MPSSPTHRGEGERWWVIASAPESYGLDSIDTYHAESVARGQVTNRRRVGLAAKLIGPCPNLLSAIQSDPQAFGVLEDQVVVVLDDLEARATIEAGGRVSMNRAGRMAYARVRDKLRYALGEKTNE